MGLSKPVRPSAVRRPLLALGAAACAAALCSTATFVSSRQGPSLRSVAMRAAMPGMPGMPGGYNTAALEELMKDPEKMKKLQADVDALMKDPEKAKQMMDFQGQIQGAVEKLKDDPELQDFFEDIKKNGMDAMQKYEKDERILRKFSEATGGPAAFPGMMDGMPGGGAPAAPAAASFSPGDQVIIQGLSKAPHLNNKKAMVVPPTPEEMKTLEGTGRMIVRLMESGEQFAVKPENLLTTAQAADQIMGSGNLEDVSLYNPALQTEATKLRESGKLNDLQNDPELVPIFEDIKKNGMGALEKYWNDEKLMAKISKAMGTA